MIAVSSTPAVSIIVRTMNEAKFLPECLQKIDEQKYGGPVEVIVVDSGSMILSKLRLILVQRLFVFQNQNLHLAGH